MQKVKFAITSGITFSCEGVVYDKDHGLIELELADNVVTMLKDLEEQNLVKFEGTKAAKVVEADSKSTKAEPTPVPKEEKPIIDEVKEKVDTKKK